jgi:hypothetical protein
VKFDKEPVTVVTAVTPYRRVYPKLKLTQKTLEDYDFLESNGHMKNRYTLLNTVTSVTSVTRLGDFFNEYKN